jgi:hypothetical protein
MLRLHLVASGMIALGVLTSCDVDLFGTDTKRVGNGYRLTYTDWPVEYRFAAPDGSHSVPVAEIDLRKPLILVHPQDTRDWDVIDTASGKHFTITEEQRRSDPTYSNISVYSADEAWHLRRKARRW